MTITNTDLLKELSQTELLQLSDINATGIIDQDVVDDAIADTLAFIESFVTLPDTPTPLLKKIGVDLTIYELRRKNYLLTDAMKEDRKAWEGYLIKMNKKLLPTEATISGSAPAPKSDKSVFRHSRPLSDTSGLRMP